MIRVACLFRACAVQKLSFKTIELKRLILLLAGFGVLITLLSSFYATYQVQRQLHIQKTLEANRAYATKVAKITSLFLDASLQQLAYSAKKIAMHFDNEQVVKSELERLTLQTDTFNATIYARENAEIVSVYPQSIPVSGLFLQDSQSLKVLEAREPMVSEPFVSPAGNFIISLSAPVIDINGTFRGFIGGAIYLDGDNILNKLMGEHFYQDGSFLYVVDGHGTLIYHKDPNRVGENVVQNDVVRQALGDRVGAQQVINTKGESMLAGFAAIPEVHWGVVAQQPLNVTLENLNWSLLRVVELNLPAIFLVFLGIYVFGSKISKPLWRMAKGVELTDSIGHNNVHNINAWYFEAAQLKAAIVDSTSKLTQRIVKLDYDRTTDPLTGLLNRRGLAHHLNQIECRQQCFSTLAVDIDHFKHVNDTFGHGVGDEVLKQLANELSKHARFGDIVCRVGGEEFLVLLPEINMDIATSVAERLRKSVEEVEFKHARRVTISIGVAFWDGITNTPNEILESADKALYKAKQMGRNQVAVV